MRIILFDQVNEIHVCESLAVALRKLGHDVVWTGPIWKGHRFPEAQADLDRVEQRLLEVLEGHPHALLNFRASSLLPRHLRQLKATGVKSLVWLPDDPVLYAVTYSHVVDHYDVMLHCGNQKILQFYDYRGHHRGINFPFWLDPERFRYAYSPQTAAGDVVFFGNMHGPAKGGRYELLCGLHDDLAIYGTVPHDPYAKCGGRIEGVDDAVSALSKYRIGLNIAQCFADYLGGPYDFSGLAMLGYYFLPSRAIQYAAIGLPALTIQPGGYDTGHYPPGLYAKDAAEARALLERLLPRTDLLTSLSRAARVDVERRFAADKRARLIDCLVSDGVDAARLTLHEREFLYQWM